jgi:hypothetical protein
LIGALDRQPLQESYKIRVCVSTVARCYEDCTGRAPIGLPIPPRSGLFSTLSFGANRCWGNDPDLKLRGRQVRAVAHPFLKGRALHAYAVLKAMLRQLRERIAPLAVSRHFRLSPEWRSRPLRDRPCDGLTFQRLPPLYQCQPKPFIVRVASRSGKTTAFIGSLPELFYTHGFLPSDRLAVGCANSNRSWEADPLNSWASPPDHSSQ